MKRTILKIAKPLVEQFPPLARQYRKLRDSRHLKREPVLTPQGFRLVGNRSMEEGQFEREETRLVSALLKDIDTVVDVGANIGYYVCLARSQSKEVIAFEPIDTNLQILFRNIEANEWLDGIEVFPLAVSDRTGFIRIFGGGTGASLIDGWAGVSKNYSKYVPTTTLDIVLRDRLVGKRPLFIVDVEGAETTVLAGACAQMSLTPRPFWLVEIIFSQHGGIGRNPHFLNAFEPFWRLGYACWAANDSRQRISKSMIIEMVRSGVDTLHCTNFLFADPKRAAEIEAG
jgi:FkbM family methyltransferase